MLGIYIEGVMSNRKQLYKYKGNQCANCGMTVDDMVARFGTFNRMFELHHVDPKEKSPKYNNLIKNNISVEQIEEVDKCVLLCRICHGVVHAQDLETTLKVSMEFEGRSVVQKMKGWSVIDRVENSMSFITNDKLLLELCWVKMSSEDEKLFCLLELMTSETIPTWLQSIEEYKSIEVWSFDHEKLIIQFSYIEKNLVNLKFSLGFPLLQMDFDVDDSLNYLWLRNGIVLTKEGEVLTKGTIESPMTLNG